MAKTMDEPLRHGRSASIVNFHYVDLYSHIGVLNRRANHCLLLLK